MTWIVFFNYRYVAYDGLRTETYAEEIEASDEDSARLTAAELILSSLSNGETAEITEVSHVA